jgi:hypothetical protein
MFGLWYNMFTDIVSVYNSMNQFRYSCLNNTGIPRNISYRYIGYLYLNEF